MQILLIEKTERDFKKEVDKLLKQGYKIQPNSVQIVNASHTVAFPLDERRYIAVLEK